MLRNPNAGVQRVAARCIEPNGGLKGRKEVDACCRENEGQECGIEPGEQRRARRVHMGPASGLVLSRFRFTKRSPYRRFGSIRPE